MIYLGTATNSYAYYIKALFISKIYIQLVFFYSNAKILGFWEHSGNTLGMKKYIMVYIPMEKKQTLCSNCI